MAEPNQPAPAVAFEAFLQRVEPRLKSQLARYRIPVDDAQDLLHEALLALLSQRDRIRDPESWLLGTLKRHCAMYWRRQQRRLYSAVDTAILEWLSAPLDPPQERAELLRDLDNLIGRLPPRCRSLLRLRFRLGYEPLEAAQKLGYRASSIGKVTTRCLAALSRELLASGLATAEDPASQLVAAAALVRT
ncbi:MAG TPA: sigma-70 family RNA polymerase sigma factor [Thermoanaerobaculia bacterium]|nr:sigma-70 family RNA polymerase sigma factor [Thermoanaerobaculia bacterium]